MNRLASHRGPDGEGYWSWDGGTNAGKLQRTGTATTATSRDIVGLGNRRLAILDLSNAGLQPMPARNQSVWISFNGEIYNYLELKAELVGLGHSFYTDTDTEVILASYQQWGINCFERFNGMWGMVLVDLKKRTLILSRDRLGIKPLYVWSYNRMLAMASEIKQFTALPQFKAIANSDAVAEYIDTGYQFPSTTFFENVIEFPPGSWAEVGLDRPEVPSPKHYWAPSSVEAQSLSSTDAKDQVRSLFEDSVKLRLRSDVPIGVSLSGGLDSSAVFGQVQLLRNGNSRAPMAFSAAFADRRFDEREHIKVVLANFGEKGHFVFPTAEAFLQELDEFVYHHDEPPGSLSQYAAWTVNRMVSEHSVPVLLNGQGGDELFSGYWPAYFLYLQRLFAKTPFRAFEDLIGSLRPGGNPELFSQLLPHLRKYLHRKKRNNRSILHPRLQTAGYTLNNNWAIKAQHLEASEYRLHELRQIHLPRLLKWDDRNSMRFGIEGRYPFLDYRLVELALTLPAQLNLKNGWNKLIVREALADLLPPSIQWRRSKVGFETPQSEWIHSEFRPALLQMARSPSKMLQQFVDKGALRRLANEVTGSGKIHKMDERHILLVRLLFLERWLEVYSVEV